MYGDSQIGAGKPKKSQVYILIQSICRKSAFEFSINHILHLLSQHLPVFWTSSKFVEHIDGKVSCVVYCHGREAQLTPGMISVVFPGAIGHAIK